MNFFADNWMWILIAFIVILMTIIGYIAEKTDFGRKKIENLIPVMVNKEASKDRRIRD